MSALSGKKILLGICGGIAAYKSAELLRRLQDRGAELRVVMTTAACKFITPLTFQALSGHPVHLDLLDTEAESAMGHIELARWADAIIIAPATANTIAKLAYGLSDDLLSAVCLATHAPLAIAPAMNHVMWSQPSTQENIASLQQRGINIFNPDNGLQACGESGEGRLMDIPLLLKSIEQLFSPALLQDINITITAGPTFEAIDPVRFIGNRSSGKMAYAIARAAQQAGANVKLISGPVHLACPQQVTRINVESAAQMLEASLQQLSNCNIFIAAAAVADYRPALCAEQKIKKTTEHLTLELHKNPDILAQVAATKNPPFTLGFAAETQNVKQNALHKLTQKNINMIAANQVGLADSGFNSEYNALDIFWAEGQQSLQRASKQTLAFQLIEILAKQYKKNL